LKNILIFSFLAIILISSSVSISDVDAQQGNRDLIAEYCVNNWQRDPVQCANYVPEDYDQNKALYSAQEAEKARQESQKIIQSKQNEQRVCSLGSHVTTDSQGNQICVDSSGRLTGYPNISETSESRDDEIGIGVFIFIIIIVIIIVIKKKSGSTDSGGYKVRRGFSQDIRDAVLQRQGGKCANCGRYVSSYQFDHKNGNRSDNSSYNAQALCPNCHDRKSRGLN
jgi:hypothetical protein